MSTRDGGLIYSDVRVYMRFTVPTSALSEEREEERAEGKDVNGSFASYSFSESGGELATLTTLVACDNSYYSSYSVDHQYQLPRTPLLRCKPVANTGCL